MSSTVVADNVEASTNLCCRLMRKQLASACNGSCTLWSYAIFWSSSPIQHGGLEWGEGYYNVTDHIKKKTKKKSGSTYGLQRSMQLRDLYLRMLQGDITTTTTDPDHGHDDDDSNLMLSADDLSDEE